jgi:hypothetical protein
VRSNDPGMQGTRCLGPPVGGPWWSMRVDSWKHDRWIFSLQLVFLKLPAEGELELAMEHRSGPMSVSNFYSGAHELDGIKNNVSTLSQGSSYLGFGSCRNLGILDQVQSASRNCNAIVG